jgi:hypothetical protein
VLDLLFSWESAEQAMLAESPISRDADTGFQSAIQRLSQLRAISAGRIESARLNQAFDYAAIYIAQVYALAEIVDRGERSPIFASSDDRFHCTLPYILDGAQAKPDGIAGRRKV